MNLQEIRDKMRLRIREKDNAIVFTEKTHKGEAGVIILRTKGCRWANESGCYNCGYYCDVNPKADVIKQFNEAIEKLKDKKIDLIKLYNSGSFFDDEEIKPSERDKIIEIINTLGIKELIVESLPALINEKKLESIKFNKKFTIAMGLESSNNEILKNCINKPHTFEMYKKASEKIKSAGYSLKSYVLLKPLFVTEYIAIKDCLKTIKDAISIETDIIGINPMTVHKGTILEWFYERRDYRPPWIHSLSYVIRKMPKIEYAIGTAGMGTRRGAHNCEGCDKEQVEEIKKAVIEQRKPKKIKCDCEWEWFGKIISP